MKSVIFDENDVPVLPHLLSHYVIDNELDKEKVQKRNSVIIWIAHQEKPILYKTENKIGLFQDKK